VSVYAAICYHSFLAAADELDAR